MGRAHKRGIINLNGHQLCAVDTETTGTNPNYHEIIQLTIVPLNGLLRPDPRFKPYDAILRPEWPERVDEGALRKIGKAKFQLAIESGIDRMKALEVLEDYFAYLQLPEGKRIAPLAQNWPFDRMMLSAYMGEESVNYYFDGRFRDTLSIANYLNDRAEFAGDQIPFPMHMDLSALARRMGVEVDDAMTHDSLYDCKLLAATYAKMVVEPLT